VTEEKIHELAKRLLERTRAGTQHWETTVSEQSFPASFPKYSVKIENAEDQGPAISIYDGSGSQIEWADENQLRARLSVATMRFGILHELFQEARRSALDVDRALDDLLASLR
jgi:hypothetical protein